MPWFDSWLTVSALNVVTCRLSHFYRILDVTYYYI